MTMTSATGAKPPAVGGFRLRRPAVARSRVRRPAVGRSRVRRLATAAAIAAAVVLGGSGCTVIAPGGPFTVNDEGGGDPLTKPFQRMIAIGPQRSWGPEETIRGLQAAMAAYPDDPTVMKAYLTPEAWSKWNAEGPVTVIENAYDVVVPPLDETSETVTKVSIKGRWVARINEDDSYTPTAGEWDREFELLKNPQGGGYRVSALPPGLVLTDADVQRAYRPTNLYYLNRTLPDTPVVDRVRLRLKTTETFAQTVLERLLQPPTEALRGAVTTSFPSGTELRSISSGEDRVVIDLSGPLDLRDLSTEAALRAQIRYSLNQNEVANGRIIEIQVNGESYSIDRPNSEDTWLEEGGDTAYYIHRGALHYLGKDGPVGAVAGAAGEPREGYGDFAVSRGGTPLVAAKTSTGISVVGIAQDATWQEVIKGSELTAPSWHLDGSLWTYDTGRSALLRYDPGSGREAEVILSPKLDGLDVTRLRIARDGVRVAVITGENTVQIGALTGEGTRRTLGNLQMLTTTAVGDKIIDIAWRDDEHLLVLVKGKAGQLLNEINVGDGETTGVPLQDRLESMAALEDRVLAEVKTADGGVKIIELSQDQQTWTPRLESNGGTPLFPLG
ncbi:LpqB family beta-propeller domain-containing protein [Nonomuraea candida]|uniref:LpqB family beta-propeller domain-containing protein n=1 Tax=Nonomuraea candida TaxID=359159 RepID=UPI0012FC32A6|nr:LpqB family beta-propeller domain-containing protein [Nonomuraea candida]